MTPIAFTKRNWNFDIWFDTVHNKKNLLQHFVQYMCIVFENSKNVSFTDSQKMTTNLT